MKFLNIYLLFIISVLCYGLVASQEDGAPAGGNASPAKRIAALRRPVGKAAKATTTTTAAPSHDDAGEEDEYNEEAGAGGDQGQFGDENEDGAAGAASSTTTTTEAPKKVGPVIRPFRSNDDFLNSLKRRQQNAKKHRAEKAPVSKPAKKSDETAASEQEESAPVAAPSPAPATSAKGYKGNSALSRRKLSKPVKAEPEADAAAEESEQQQKEEEAKPKRPLSSRLALRKRN